MSKARFKRLLEEARKHDDYWVQDAIHGFTEQLYELMERRGMRKSELAERIGSSPAYITKVMRGNTNFTIESMVRLVRALEGKLWIKVSGSEDAIRWLDMVPCYPANLTSYAANFNFQSLDTDIEELEEETIGDDFLPAAA